MTKHNLLKNLGIELSNETDTLLTLYQKEFIAYNSHTNLISKNDEKVLFEKHIYDSLSLNLFSGFKSTKNLLDIGTGGGFPACPIAIVHPDIEVVGVDSIGKKINFINLLANKLSLKNLCAIASRTEDLPVKYYEKFDLVTSRAVAPLNVILEYAVPFIKVGGYFAAYKAKIVNEEIEQAQNALKVLNCRIDEVIEYKLPLEENFERNLVIIKKLAHTPKGFPRRAGTAKSNPL